MFLDGKPNFYTLEPDIDTVTFFTCLISFLKLAYIYSLCSGR